MDITRKRLRDPRGRPELPAGLPRLFRMHVLGLAAAIVKIGKLCWTTGCGFEQPLILGSLIIRSNNGS